MDNYFNENFYRSFPFIKGWQNVKCRKNNIKSGQPLVIKKAKGVYVWDNHNRKYVDFLMGWGTMAYGHNDDKINSIILKNLENASIINGHTDIAIKVGRLFNKFYNEENFKTGFFVNGSDAVSSAVRISRNVTGKKKVLFTGYHGWHDWAQPHCGGILSECTKMSCDVRGYAGAKIIQSVEENHTDLACVIVEIPLRIPDANDVIIKLRKLADERNFFLVFDEIKSGIRMGLTPGKKLYNICPDMATYGKAFAGGMPFSALIVKESISKRIVNELCLSATYWGHPFALYIVEHMIENVDKISNTIEDNGRYFVRKFNEVFRKHGTSIALDNIYSMPRIKINLNSDVVDRFYSASFDGGIYMRRFPHCMFISTGHDRIVVDSIMSVFDGIARKMKC